MRARLLSTRVGLLAGAGLLLVLATWSRARPQESAAASASMSTGMGTPQAGAQEKFLRARREQALIRAETTALLLHVLAAAPTLAGGGS